MEGNLWVVECMFLINEWIRPINAVVGKCLT